MSDIVSDGASTVAPTDGAADKGALQVRLAAYAAAVSLEEGMRPDQLLTDADRADLSVTEADLGVPRGILLLIDRMMTMIAPTARIGFANALRDAAPEQRDQSAVVGAFVIWMLNDPHHGAHVVVRNPEVVAAIKAVVDAQRFTLNGEVLMRADWASIRKIATTGSDPARDGRASHFAALCAEAAAWPPAASPTVGVQTLEPWSNIVGGIVDAEQAWSLADYEVLQTTMQKVWEDSAPARTAGEQPDMDALMLIEAPKLAPRWDRHVARSRSLSAVRMAAACDELVRLMKGPAA